MSLIILDMGSGNTCKNNPSIVEKMIDTVAAIDNKKHNIILKWQLDEKDPPGQKKLNHDIFTYAYEYSKMTYKYPTTASVFDIASLNFLLSFPVIPFVKIACNESLYFLAGLVMRCIPIYISYDCRKEEVEFPFPSNMIALACVPEYPARLSDYKHGIHISDHTPGLELWNYYHPCIIEKHFVLEREADNPDSGPFAIDPEQLKEMLA